MDSDVSTRYRYGEIRLTRLNFYAPIVLGKSHFQRVAYQYSDYFARFYGPLLFGLAVVSVVLSGLQVVVSLDDPAGGRSRGLFGFALGFSFAMMACSLGLLLFLALLLAYKVGKEWHFAIQDRKRVLREENKGDGLSP